MPFTGAGLQTMESGASHFRNAPRTPRGLAECAKAYSASTTVVGSESAATEVPATARKQATAMKRMPGSMPETWAPGGTLMRATSRGPTFERGRGPPKTPRKTRCGVALIRAARSPHRYWRGGVAPGSAVPEFAGGDAGGVV